MLVRFLKAMAASPDGLAVRWYEKDSEHYLPAQLGEALIRYGYAETVSEGAQDAGHRELHITDKPAGGDDTARGKRKRSPSN